MRRNRAAALCVLALGVTSGAWLLYRYTHRAAAPQGLDTAGLAAAAKSEFARMDMRSTALEANVEAVATALHCGPNAEPFPGALAGVRMSVREFLMVRMFEPDSARYIAHRRSEGLKFLDRKTLVETWGLADDCLRVTGTTLTDDIPLESAFDALWKDAWTTRLVCLPTSVPGDARGTRVAFGTLTATNQVRPQFVDGDGASDIRSDLWYGGIAATMRPWFDARRHRDGLVARHGKVDAASVALAIKVTAEDFAVLVISLYFDSEASAWVVESLNLNNYPSRLRLSNIDF